MRFADLIPWRHRPMSRSSDDSVTSFRRELENVFDNFVEPWTAFSGDGRFSPAIDVTESETTIDVKAELPGMDEKDIEVLLHEDRLTIRGEKREESEKTEKGVHVQESAYGRFERVIPITTEIEPDKVKAHFEKGVLKVTLPKSEKTKEARRKIPVTV